MNNPTKYLKEINRHANLLRNKKGTSVWSLHNKIIYLLNTIQRSFIKELINEYISEHNKDLVENIVDTIHEDNTNTPEGYKKRKDKIDKLKLDNEVKRLKIVKPDDAYKNK